MDLTYTVHLLPLFHRDDDGRMLVGCGLPVPLPSVDVFCRGLRLRVTAASLSSAGVLSFVHRVSGARE